MSFSAPVGIVFLALAALLYRIAWQASAALLAAAVLACFVALVRLSRTRGEIPRGELIGLLALLIGLMAAVGGVLSLP